MLYCCKSSLLLSFGPCSKAPKPEVLFEPLAEIVAKSAKLASKFNIAAIPPVLSISERRNSLNHTSPRILSLCAFFSPTIKFLTNPKFGFPFIDIFNGPRLVFPANEGSSSKSSLVNTPSGSVVGSILMANIFNFVNNASGKSILFNSGQISSAVAGVGINGVT